MHAPHHPFNSCIMHAGRQRQAGATHMAGSPAAAAVADDCACMLRGRPAFPSQLDELLLPFHQTKHGSQDKTPRNESLAKAIVRLIRQKSQLTQHMPTPAPSCGACRTLLRSAAWTCGLESYNITITAAHCTSQCAWRVGRRTTRPTQVRPGRSISSSSTHVCVGAPLEKYE